ncbi:MAG TPA: class I SAM-dependent methyltransferase [Verrucomicrobiae bacterium]|nr:class I SAM-dependent methyltransferase [Verrucomicrobiae bacterium]
MQTTSKTFEPQDSLLFFENSNGLEVQATLRRYSRHLAVFEIYGGAEPLRASEVLPNFKILAQGQPIFSGRAVVSNVVSTGAAFVCEATLDGAWVDATIASLSNGRSDARGRFDGFLSQWQKTYRIRPEYKVIVADLEAFLNDLRLWLEQIELGIRSLPSADRLDEENKIVTELAPSTTPALEHFFGKFELAARDIEPDLAPAHAAYCRRHLHPHLMASPFMHRIYSKPLGYAGDYEMVNMILRNPCEGSSLLGKLLNVFILNQIPAVAHRNRVAYLTRRLVEESARAAREGRRLRVMNLGCGPAMEVQNFLKDHAICDNAQFELLDFDEETLAHTRQILETIRARNHRQTPIKLIKRSVQQLIKQAGKPRMEGQQEFDLIYCAGLFDYLNDNICRTVLGLFHHLLAPGGLMLATNVEGQNPIRNVMEYIFEWHLIYRTSPQFLKVLPDQVPPAEANVLTESSAGNIFIEARKAATPRRV